MLRSCAAVLVAFLGAPLLLGVGCDSTPERAPSLSNDSGAPLDATAGDTHVPVDSSTTDSDASDALIEADVAVDETDAADVADAAPETSDAAGDADGGDGGPVCHPALTESHPGGACAPLIQSWDDEGHTHVPSTTMVSYCTKPPSSGSHYPDWADFKVYDAPVPYGNLVHSMEHGAVVLLYQCATAMLPCKTTQDKLVTVANAQPVDPLCTAPTQRRIIIAPDPGLDVPVAAAAWTWTYRATCVDPSTLGSFISAHYAMAAENFCSAGIDPTDAGVSDAATDAATSG